MSNSEFDSSERGWISRGFEQLVARVEQDPTAVLFDVLIVGSGYGGAIAADTFAGRESAGEPLAVAVLERGNEYLPGAFPATLAELPKHVRMDRQKEGLFDIRPGPEVVTVVANGVGGGSLINAGVMEVPTDAVFAKGWPSALANAADRSGYYERALELLGASRNGMPNTIDAHPKGPPRKLETVEAIAAAGTFRRAAITVAMTDGELSSGNVELRGCRRCGDCATGCNHGAKSSLDVNLLVRAHRRGAQLFSGATVLRLERESPAGTWIAHAVHTNAKLRARYGATVPVRARRIVLAAGALGSVEILLRSQSAALSFSSRLGQRVSTNGDMLVVDYDTDKDVLAIADPATKPSARAVGPTITGIVDLRSSDGLVVEEMAVPSALRRAFGEIFATVDALHSLESPDRTRHERGFPDEDIYSLPSGRIDRSALYAVMGDDGAAGTIELNGEPTDSRDGIARIRWEGLPYQTLFDRQIEKVRQLTAKTGGRVLPNPVWSLLPSEMSWLLDGKRGPLTTVHPLGGCVMGDSVEDSVVDDCGRVFDPAGQNGARHDGLVVLDGSIVPTALGTNPALTIAALALRASEKLALDWGFVLPTVNAPAQAAADVRPVFRAADIAETPVETEVEVIERLTGTVRFRDSDGKRAARVVELTLRFKPKALADLAHAPHDGRKALLEVDAGDGDAVTASRVRIYDEAAWRELHEQRQPAMYTEQQLDGIALFDAPLAGRLTVLERQPSRRWPRTLRAGGAYLLNRGLRDIWQAVFDGDTGPGFWSRLKGGLALASRAGEVRALVYELDIGQPAPAAAVSLGGSRIVARKRFTYGRRANPWRQLMEVRLDEFPGLDAAGPRVLSLDVRYLARIGVPLFRITKQADGVTAAAELISFIGYFVRLLLGLHIWSFRSPDSPVRVRRKEILPGAMPGLPAPEVHSIQIGQEAPDGGGAPVPVRVRLARYARHSSARNPVLMLHGYSAGGTTFAHRSVNPNFAHYFWREKQRDVWVADLRTSSGMPETATLPWSFEQVAYRDVPAAVAHIFAATGRKVDIIAHCMGAAVLGMALLHAKEGKMAGESVQQMLAREALPDRIDRVALTQVGPLVVMSPANIFRGYALSYLKEFLPDHYSFNPGPDASLADDLWDRLLSTLPYPEEEFDIENPLLPWRRTEWVRTRHRMDALYGRDFNVRNMSRDVLRAIDDHFGALSLGTVSQTIHFARFSTITNRAGRNVFVGRRNLEDGWGSIPTLSVHGRNNGLSDVATVHRMKAVFEDAGRVFRPPRIVDGAGHQDALIGSKRLETMKHIGNFLDEPIDQTAKAPRSDLVAYPPWIGPVVTIEPIAANGPSVMTIRIGTRPTHRAAEGVVMLRVGIDGDTLVRPDDPSAPWDITAVEPMMVLHTSPKLRTEGWDAFPAPQPPAVHAGGDALLVLVVYDEAPVLNEDTQGPFALIEAPDPDASPRIVQLSQLRWVPIDSSTSVPTYETFHRIAEAALTELRMQLRPRSDDPSAAGRRTHNVVLMSAEARSAFGTAMTGSTMNVPMNGETALFYGRRNDAGEAVLDRLVEQDRALTDGVIPDLPPAAADTTAFLLGSCQYPAGFFDEPVAYEGYRRVEESLRTNTGLVPRFAVLTGDQVYVDPTAGLYDPSAKDDPEHQKPYERWLRQRQVRNVLRRIPSFMLLDDHEIEDNWEPSSVPNPVKAALGARGVAAFRKFQRGVEIENDTLSRQFERDGFPFFMLDTRYEREPRSANIAAAKLVRDSTMAALEAWLASLSGPKFVVTPAMLLPRHRVAARWDEPVSALHSDGWDGYRASLCRVLSFLVDNQAAHTVFLSGDEHRACVATIDVMNLGSSETIRLHSLHTPGVYAPFPFANSLEADFLADDVFDFDHEGESYRCTVATEFATGSNSLTLLRPWRNGGVWQLDYQHGDSFVGTLTL